MKLLTAIGLLVTASSGLSSSAATILTALAALVTAGMAVVAWRGSRRLQAFQRQEAERDQATQELNERADLLRAEHEGWQAIIKEQRQHGRELEERLQDAEGDRRRLRKELHDALSDMMVTRQEMGRMRTSLERRAQQFEKRVHDLESQLERRRKPSAPRPGGKRKTDPTQSPD